MAIAIIQSENPAALIMLHATAENQHTWHAGQQEQHSYW